jgi:hypothetical protein
MSSVFTNFTYPLILYTRTFKVPNRLNLPRNFLSLLINEHERPDGTDLESGNGDLSLKAKPLDCRRCILRFFLAA